MLEVKVTLNHEGEVALFAEFTQIIRRNRRVEAGTLTAADTSPRVDSPSQQPAPEPAIDAAYATNAPAPVEEAIVVGFITPEGSTITDAMLIEAFQKYAAGKKVADLLTLLGTFGATKVSEIPQEKRAAFLQAVSV